MTTVNSRNPVLVANRLSEQEPLTAVPRQWEVRKLKHCLGVNEATLSEATDPAFEFQYIEIGGVSSGGLREAPAIMRFKDAPSRARRIIKRGDTIVSTVRTYLKAVWYADNPGDHLVCSTGFAVLTPNEGIVSKFATYVAQSSPFTDQVTAESVGIAYPAISEKKLGELLVWLPPLEEQSAIVRYLDEAEQQIQAYISAKEKLIAFLEEQRQAIIHQAVTRGIDPNVKLKPSGVEWLGDVPEHWEIKRIKTLAKAKIGLTYSPQDIAESAEGTLVLRASNIRDRKIVDADNVYVQTAVPQELILKVGDILVCSRSGSRSLIGNNARIGPESAGSTFGAFMTILRGQNNDYLYQLLNSQLFDQQSGMFMTSTINQLTLGMINNMKVPIPPPDDQQEILTHLRETTSEADVTISQTRRQIELMEEYRTRLIADVVTGKLDVREAVQALP